MGCGESKPARTQIKVTTARPVGSDPTEQAVDLTKPRSGRSAGASGQSISSVTPTLLVEDDLDIPNCDLGESLDARNGTLLFEDLKSHSAMSKESADSGIYDLDENYSHVITEHSAAEMVKLVERDFKPPYELELEVVGKAVPRLLSGYQKNRMEEKQILQSLREEGLIAMPKAKATNGLSFDIVDIKETDGVQRRGASAVQERLPSLHLQSLEARRRAHVRRVDPEADQREKEERRKAAEEERVQKITMKQQYIEEAKQKRIEEKEDQLGKKIDTALDKRQKHLNELRDKLKGRQEHAKQVQLKKALRNFGQPVTHHGGRPVITEEDDKFFN
ncbi:uncharacterized protein LOC119106470 [Pollicipes pollicipes]|uniref:uncharacterized protein LOC119106084 n=1 Tax=Pollicipes pollicipes TaxID=41117 RepID=UPI0018853FCF|nr:uncharacterized protein LOC119106084 [Pollicipes pollicipes]XP_037086010.1 uncharacterized protein LOC119106470 [Pollicipes pollicipes]